MHPLVRATSFPRLWLLTLALTAIPAPAAFGQMSQDQAAVLLLNSARRAYNEHNYGFATARFREFLQRYGGHKDANSARYGLALCLIEGPDHNYNEALQHLQPVAGNASLPDQPYAVYYTAYAHRALGLAELIQGRAKPAEAAQRRNNANARFTEAARHFATAVNAFTGRVKEPDPAKELPTELEWAARARCDQAEMYLRVLKAKEALTAVIPFLEDRLMVKSRYRRLGLYYHGFSSFLLADYLNAGKSLNQLTPFADPVFGTHARYLLARVHHLDDEKAEAAAHYEGVLSGYAKQVQEAKEALKNPQAFKNDPEEKARLTALASDPPPDHVARATLFLGVLQYEGGKFADALARFNDFQKQFPQSPLIPEAQLRAGFCQVQLKQWTEAVKSLQPLPDKHPHLADQSLLWLGKAQAGGADPANQTAWLQAQKTAIDTLRKAADRASAADPETKARRGLILLEMIDIQQGAKLYRDAVNVCNQLLNEKLLPDREPEVLQSLATALHLAGDYTESDKVCVRFQGTHGNSPLLPAVLFRYAENAAFAARGIENNPGAPNRAQELKRLQEETVKRYQALVEKFPEFSQINLARYGLALAHFRKGDFEKAKGTLEAIPQAERAGDLAAVPYLLADCHIRLAPIEAEDALAAGEVSEHMNKAAELLAGFVAASPKAPEVPDALLKLGHCHLRMVDVLAQAPDRAKALAAARAAYERLIQGFPQHALAAQAIFEHARCLALATDVNGAINELRRFTAPPLKTAPIAPMAVLRLSTLLRKQNQAAEAARVLEAARQAHEANLQKDPDRAAWVPLLQYHHGVALKEAGKLPEARQVFENVFRQFPNTPEAIESSLRCGQCLKDEGLRKVEQARKQMAQSGRNPQQQTQDRNLLNEGLKLLGESVRYLETHAEQVRQKKADSPARARMLYDAAWAARAIAEQEIDTTRQRLRQQRWQVLREEAARKTPPGQPTSFVPAPEVPLSAVPVQPAETKTRALYQNLIAAFPDLTQSIDARFELAELFSDRGEHDAAVKLLQEALDREPGPELTEKVRLRLGACLEAKGSTKAALAHFEMVASNEKSPLRAQAVYRAGECHLHIKDYQGAVKELSRFRDFGPFQNIPGLTDRALLRLGHALAGLKQWDASRQAHEQVVGRFPQSPWVHEARYGIGWAHQHKGEYDQAVNAYTQVAAGVVTELGARAQLNIGLCRLAQKRYPEASTALLVVPFTYDYPELNAVALLEAARALAEDKQRDRAVRLLERLLRDHPDGEPAEAARKRLEELRKG
jgi:TolA-binding protein